MRTFRLFNIIHIILTLVLFGYTFYFNKISFSDTGFFLAVTSLPLLVAVNCASNINLVKRYFNGASLDIGRKVFFWIFFVLFITINALLVFAIYENYGSLIRVYKQGYPVSSTFIIKNILLLLVVSNSIYIAVYQVYFFFSFKKNKKLQLETVVNEIGEPDQV